MTVSSAAADTTPAERATKGFVHLHVHTEFSKQDGLSRLGDLVASIKADGQDAVAMTDHGNFAGAWKFVGACKKAGIKPILGIEAYMALVPDGSDPEQPALAWDDPAVRFAKTYEMGMDAESGKVKRNTNNHLTLLVRNEAGWRNLCAITNAAEESFYHKPLIDYALIKKHSEGLIILTGCLGGPVASQVAAARLALRQVEEIENPTEQQVAAAQERYEAKMAKARENLEHLIECVGAENVYVEIMEHGLEAEGKEHIRLLTGLADEYGLKIVATNDSHYVDCDHADAHDSWLVNGERARGNTKITKDDPDRWRFNGEGYWMRTEAEMRSIYTGKRWQEACDNTVELADRIENDVIPFKALRLPKFPVPADVVAEWEAGEPATVTDINGVEHPARKVGKRVYRGPSALYLHRLVKKGAEERYGGVKSELGVRLGLAKRLNFEFDVITGMGLEDYFLIVWDVLAWARSDRGLPNAEHPDGAPGGKKPILVGPGRGSAAGSATSYCLWIVMVEPLANGLLFERFLDVARIGMPDIDVDFEAARRDEVYTYLAAKYGAEYIARIGAFQVAKTKRAIKDAARVLEKGPLGEKLAGLVPVHQGSPQKFAKVFDRSNAEASEFRDLVESNLEAAEVIALAQAFEDVVAGESIHAAGVIISDEPLTNLIPMRRERDKKTGKATGVPIALWDGKDVDSFGMLKLDALSLSNLDIIAAAVDNIEAVTGERVDPDLLPDPDTKGDERVEKAFALLRDGKTSGIFQLESSGITELCEAIAPTAFGDLSALVALYRPGPMGANMHTLYADRKNGRADVDYGIYTKNPTEEAVIKTVLDDTFGVIAYQEQMMILAEVVAGFSADEKNRLRKAFSKKDRPAMEALKGIFITQGQQQMTLADGTDKIAFAADTLERLWVTFDASAEYLFNKSHSAAYGYLAYVTAYLKANWPTEYAAGILAVVDKAEKRLATLFALRADGIAVLAPDVNASRAETSPDVQDPAAVRLGLTEIRDVGNNGRWIVAERERGGDFTSVADLMSRVKVPDKDGNLTAKLPVTAVEGLVEAGAFDSLGYPRLGLMIALRALSSGVEVTVPDAEWSPLERSTRERVRLGVALGEHPLKSYGPTLREYSFNPREDRWGNIFGGKPIGLHNIEPGVKGTVITLGVLTSWAEKTTRRGGKLANFTVEGTKSSITGTAFNEAISTMRKSAKFAQVGDIVAVAGQMKTRVITNMVMNDEGEEVEETREVSELIASHIEVVSVDRAPEFNLPEVPEDKRVNLSNVIDLARRRASKIAEEGKAAPRKTKSKPTDDAADAHFDGQTALLTGFDEDAVTSVEPTAAAVTQADKNAWDAIRVMQNGLGLPVSVLGEDHVALQTSPASGPKPDAFAQFTAADIAYKYVVSCICRCSKCTTKCEGHYEPEAGCTCACEKCNKAMPHTGRQVLFLFVHRSRQAEVAKTAFRVDPNSPAWTRNDSDLPGWFSAPVDDVLDVKEEPVGEVVEFDESDSPAA